MCIKFRLRPDWAVWNDNLQLNECCLRQSGRNEQAAELIGTTSQQGSSSTGVHLYRHTANNQTKRFKTISTESGPDVVSLAPAECTCSSFPQTKPLSKCDYPDGREEGVGMLQLHRIAQWKSLLENDITDDERTMHALHIHFPKGGRFCGPCHRHRRRPC